jgi:hypothetical protein
VGWTYRVVNNGDTALEGVTVVDPAAPDIACPGTVVAPGGQLTCTATGDAVAGQQAGTARVTASVVPSGATARALAVTEVDATSTWHYFGMALGATLTATVNGTPATSPPGPALDQGVPATVRLRVSNTGNVPLDLASVDSGDLGALQCGTAAVVAPGQTLECTTRLNPAVGRHVHPVSAHLTGPDRTAADGTTTRSTAAPAATVYFVVAPTDGGPSNKPPAPAAPGTGRGDSGGDGSPGTGPGGLAFTGPVSGWVWLVGAVALLLGVFLLALRERLRPTSPRPSEELERLWWGHPDP